MVEIVKTEEVCGGSPRIEGRRVRVMDIILAIKRSDLSREEIAERYMITEEEVESAIYYYIKNPKEIEEEIEEYMEAGIREFKIRSQLMTKDGGEVDHLYNDEGDWLAFKVPRLFYPSEDLVEMYDQVRKICKESGETPIIKGGSEEDD